MLQKNFTEKNMHVKISDIKDVHTVTKPWGYEKWIAGGAPDFKYAFKEIFFRSSFRTSIQFHKFKEETNYVLKGKGILYYSKEVIDAERYEKNLYSKEEINKIILNLEKGELIPGKIVHIKPGCVHRIESLEDLTIIESSSVELDDVFRLEDDTGRKHGRIESEHSSE